MSLPITEKDIAGIVTRIYESPDLAQYPYHNLAHTVSVVAHVKEIADHYRLNDADHFILAIAAWFHDIGHLYGGMKEHEERGVVIMRHYLQDTIPANIVDAIGSCILVTKLPSHPANLREQIICDADTYHLGTSLFRQTDVLVEKEMKIRTGKTFPLWHLKSLQFLKMHCFFTDYCRHLLEEGKKQNIAWLENLIDHQPSQE